MSAPDPLQARARLRGFCKEVAFGARAASDILLDEFRADLQSVAGNAARLLEEWRASRN